MISGVREQEPMRRAPTGLAAWAPAAARIDVLDDAYGTTPAELAEAFAKAFSGMHDRVLRADEPLPFESLFLPLVRCARARVEQGCEAAAWREIGDGARGALERALLRRLTRICAHALYVEYSVHRRCEQQMGRVELAGCHERFLSTMRERRLLSFFSSYAEAARLCGTVTELWIATTTEFLGRLRRDRPALQAVFAHGQPLGQVVEIQTGLSDPHHGGRSVWILHLSSGLRLVYKPRSIGAEELLGELFTWLNEHGDGPALRSPRMLARPTHGWIEFVEHSPCQDRAALDRYFDRCGTLLCLAYVLGSTDLHCENLIAAGEHPVLIDGEALLTHPFTLLDSLPAADAGQDDRGSVLCSGLLPLRKVDGDGRAEDMGALTATPDAMVVSVSSWNAVNQDAMSRLRRTVSLSRDRKNLPVLDGTPVSAVEHLPPLVEGFRRTYRLLRARPEAWLDRGGLLDRARGRRLRFIFRDTSLYARLMERCLHPAFLRAAAERRAEYETLARPLSTMAERPVVRPILRAEYEALDRMDIPCFDADAGSTSLTLPTGERVDGCFSRSAVAAAADRIRALSEADLARQLRLIEEALQR